MIEMAVLAVLDSFQLAKRKSLMMMTMLMRRRMRTTKMRMRMLVMTTVITKIMTVFYLQNVNA